MKTSILVIIATLILAGAIEDASAQRQRVPRGAFLRTRVSSVEEMADQCMRDPVVRARFARHFGIPPERLGDYLRDNVEIRRVTSSKPRKVFFVTPSGQVVSKTSRLRKGEAVFVLKDTGQPLFVQACGNPILKELPPRVKIEAKPLPSYQVLRPTEVPVTREAVPPPPPKAIPPVAVLPPEAPIAPVVPLVPGRGAPPLAAVPRAPGARFPFPILIPPLLLGNGNGGRAPIPEPGGAAMVFVTGLLPVVGYGLHRLRAAGKAAHRRGLGAG
ncbi:MAG: hypothetical protein HYX78_02590 [Armatimonadetes bacterium]|nr:hypothetical protein [Armatimonadota bacterium]